MYKKILLISLIAFTLISPVRADEATDNLKKRLQESLSSPIPTPISLSRAYIGVVRDVIKDTVIIQDKDGKKDIKLQDDSTILRSPGNAIIKPENIRIGDYIIAIGYPESGDVLTGRRLIVSVDPINSPAKSSGLGTLTKLTKTTLTLKLADLEQDLSLSSKTLFKTQTGLLELADLSVGDTLVYTATIDADDDLTATIIMRIQTASIPE